MKIIITGATGMIGEGVLLAALNHPAITGVLMVNRRTFQLRHPKLSELIVKDFTDLDAHGAQLTGYDGCFYCAGISSFGMNEEKYNHITFYTTLMFAKRLADLNPHMVFFYLSGVYADSSENGKIMWARVKGKTENTLKKLHFRAAYSFRPGFIIPLKVQENVRLIYKGLNFIYPFLFRNQTLTYDEIVNALARVLTIGYKEKILEIKDLKLIARQNESNE
ncbi:NAD-dependent epimerase/dehydratase family protein [Chryseobacterium indoltheticum]|uniref:NAD-dependent epimerase/dehydratase family protein n=1 Tax=Chryseobacterium indoltheticum TaxID=254 RepID=UPI001912424E|nr:NAD-dependent epimerase/dehydratase family protein [Chryseobacterium indoltheticum]QQQ29032.1 NAD-dependent epimerase/dehydratase family protein [Chryseobacterium indoltheticum]